MTDTYTQRVNIVIATILKDQQKVQEAVKKYKSLGGIHESVSRSIIKSAIKQDNAQKLVESRQRSLRKLSKEHGVTVNEVSGALNNQGAVWKRNVGWVDKAGNRFRNLNSTMTKGFTNMRKFQMEQLGVMFSGMALNRAMSNLSSTAREWVGLNELMSIAMGQLMLPTTLDLLNFGVLPLFNAFTNLPEPAKKAIGLLALGLEGLGAVMMTGGQLMLGMDATTTFLAKWAQVNPNKVFTAKGLTKIGDKLKGSLGTLQKIGKFAVAGILMSIVIKDLSEDQVVAAVGGTAMAAGVIMGGKKGGAVFAIGAVLKLVGDEQFLIDTIKTMFRVGETINSILKEAVISGLTPGKGFNIENIEGFANIKDAFNIAAEQLSMERGLEGIGIAVIYPTTQIQNMREEIAQLKLDSEDDLIDEDVAIKEIALIQEVIDKLIKRYEVAFMRAEKLKNSVENIEKIATEERRTNVSRQGLVENVLFPGIAGSVRSIFQARGQGSSEKNIVVNNNTTFNGFSGDDIDRKLDNRDNSLVEKLRRIFKLNA